MNAVDGHLLHFLWRGNRLASIFRLKRGLDKALLMMSDQQIVTGLALLAAGYSQLTCGGITAHHWLLMLYTVWMSSFTHLATITLLSSFFRARPVVRTIRVILVLCTIVLMIGALLPVASSIVINSSHNIFLGLPILCWYRSPGFDFIGMTNTILVQPKSWKVLVTGISIFILVIPYVLKLLELYEVSIGISDALQRLECWTETMITRISRQDRYRVVWVPISDFLLIHLMLYRAFTLIVNSFVFQVRNYPTE